jgi:c-di-GMP-binding flagellar brake protein YcgR
VTNQDYEEKRGFVRMRIDTLVTYTIKGKSGQTYHGTSQDLSATGLYMTTENAVEVGDEIELVMNSSNQLLPPFVAEGKVVRCIADKKEMNFHVSLELSDIKRD